MAQRPLRPRIRDRRVVYRNQYHRVYTVRADFGDFAKQYFVTDYGHRVGLVVVKAGAVLLVRQYRLLIKRLSWEVPGGKIDRGESAVRAAIRECLEESGVRCRGLRPLLTFQPGLDALHNPTHLFHTDRFTEEARSRHDGEVEACQWVPLDQCLSMIDDGRIVDSLSIIALFAYARMVSKAKRGTEVLSLPQKRLPRTWVFAS